MIIAKLGFLLKVLLILNNDIFLLANNKGYVYKQFLNKEYCENTRKTLPKGFKCINIKELEKHEKY